MFIDEVTIHIFAGDGGNGAVTFRHEKHVPRGGPDGGDGGRGGSVVLESDANLSTLLDFRGGRKYKAPRGGDGAAKRQFGKDGGDLVLKVPPGTQAIDDETGEILADVAEHPMRAVVARGGRGGRGNTHFVSSVQQAPKFAERGEPGETRTIRLELKSLADVGLLGFPNVGKSTLLAAVSAARPKIADYPFTTLVPNLGLVRVNDAHSFVIADVPGVIEGASEGAGLGLRFLKHLERTRLLLHLLDVSGMSGRDPLEDHRILLKELAAFSPELAALPQRIVLSRVDLVADRSELDAILAHFAESGTPVHVVSAVTGEGISDLLYATWTQLGALPRPAASPSGVVRIGLRDARADDPRRFDVVRADDGALEVRGTAVERTVAMTDLGNSHALRRLQRQLERWGVFRRLKESGAVEGDTVRIRGFEFDYIDDDAPPPPEVADEEDDTDVPV
ncbi:MAG: GTPase ObgE [Armatimonadota bacterium]